LIRTRQSEKSMQTIHSDARDREVNKLRVLVSREMPRVTEETGVSWTSFHTRGLPGGGWTSGTVGALARQLEATQVVVANVPAGGALDSTWVGRNICIMVMGPTSDTSNAVEDASELKRHLLPSSTMRRRITEVAGRFVATVRSDDTVSISELRENSQQGAPIDQDLAARQRALLDRAGGGLTTTEVAQRLNVSEQEVDELRAAGRLVAVPDPDSLGWAYPACQFEGPQIVPGLPEVLSDFSVKSPWTRLYVLIGEDPALDGRTPFEALKDGDLDMVREIVSGYGQQGGD
jgi:hypothetical protein